MKIEVGLKYKIVNSSEINAKIGTVHDIRNGVVSVYFGSNPNDVGCDDLYTFIEKIEKGELIVINDEFKLPEKWCIKPKDEEEAELIFSFEGISKHQDSKSIIHYQHYPPYKMSDHPDACTACRLIQFGYTEITIEQFKKYVLNTDIETIDYSYLISFIKQLET
jgi:hypothetical protein